MSEVKIKKTTLTVKRIIKAISKESAQQDLELLESILGVEELKKKFSAMSLDINHSGVRSIISPLAMLYRLAQKHKLEKPFLKDLKQIVSIVSGGEYHEFYQRYVTLLIVEKEFPDVTSALPEYKVVDESNPDWTFRTPSSEFYVETTAISIQKTIEDIQAFDGRLPTGQIIKSFPQPLYFEIIFPDNPRKYDPGIIGKLIINAVKTQQLPINFVDNGVQIFVDLLSNRQNLPQIISSQLSNIRTLKSTRIMGNRLIYTLATQILLKSIEDKINEKKYSNGLKKLGNAWICIFASDTNIEDLSKDKDFIKQMQARISKSKWLKGIIVADLSFDAKETWRLSYLKIN